MRETRVAQSSIFDFFAPHEFGQQLRELSALLDDHDALLDLAQSDLRTDSIRSTGANGLSVESVLRCLLLRQILGCSYEQLSFHLCDSPSYRAFTRVKSDQLPKRSTLQAAVRGISASTIERMNELLVSGWISSGQLELQSLCIDSTVVQSNISPPSDSQLLVDGIRVLSRMMAKSVENTGVKIRFVDQRQRSKSLGYQIFNAKKAQKDDLYPELLRCASVVNAQADRAVEKVCSTARQLSELSLIHI